MPLPRPMTPCSEIPGAAPARVPLKSAASLIVAVLLAALAGGVASADLQAQSVQFRYQFTEGLDLRYEVIQNTSSALPGGMGSMEQGQTQVMHLRVASVDADGNARVQSTIESVRMELQSPMGNQTFDSEDGVETADPALRPLAAMVGVTSEFELGPDGHLRDSGDMAAVFETMMADFSPQERAMMEDAFSGEALESMFSQSFQVLPAESISVGDAWEDQISIPLPFGTMTSEFVYTLESVEDRGGSRVGMIRITGSMGALEIDPSNAMASMIEFDGGEISGTAEFDVTRGLFIASTVTTSMEMAVMGETMTSVTEVETRLMP